MSSTNTIDLNYAYDGDAMLELDRNRNSMLPVWIGGMQLGRYARNESTPAIRLLF